VATREKPWMNEGGPGKHGFRCGFLVTFSPAEKVTRTGGNDLQKSKS
jgi:hypothetical protein